MRYLLDTQILLWAAGQPDKLSKPVRILLDDLQNELLFSAASLWEIAIKNAIGRDDFELDVRLFRRGLRENGYTELAISGEHAANLDLLPPIHKDPFDRILVAQALSEGLVLLTADAVVAQYPGAVRKI
jgi:PIN domain nuclease of toxin-antitoxin system